MKHLRGAAGIILSLIFAVCFMCSPAFAASRLYQGMDVSSWQGDIDFQAVRAAGISRYEMLVAHQHLLFR